MTASKSKPARKDTKEVPRETPWLEWAASGLGLAIVVAVVALLGWNAIQDDGAPPAVHVESGRVSQRPGGFTLEIVAHNRSRATAAAVEIEGVLVQGGQPVETARITLDYVPGQSTRRGGLFFRQDPRALELQLRALGYAEP